MKSPLGCSIAPSFGQTERKRGEEGCKVWRRRDLGQREVASIMCTKGCCREGHWMSHTSKKDRS